MTIIFFGSDDFALVNLERVVQAGFSVRACVTQPDRPAGRGLKLLESPIKVYARQQKIPLLQPESLKDAAVIAQLKDFAADLLVVVAYGQILPPAVLQLARLGAVNVHGSLLPKYRGAAPVNWAVINGEKETGVSVIQMNARMDAGDILWQESLMILPTDTAGTLRQRMAKLGAECLVKTILPLEKGKLRPVSQDEKQVTLAPKLTKELGRIDWKKSAVAIHNLVHGLQPRPAAYTYYQGKVLKILETEVMASAETKSSPGTVLTVGKDGVAVAAGEGTVLVKQVHPESGKPMPAKSFAAGYKISPNSRFGK